MIQCNFSWGKHIKCCCSVSIKSNNNNKTTSVSYCNTCVFVSKIERKNISILKCGYETDVPFPLNSLWFHCILPHTVSHRYIYTRSSVISNLSLNHTCISSRLIMVERHNIYFIALQILNGPCRLSKCPILIRFNMEMGQLGLVHTT